ncbi:MAG: hypothetical protein EXR48_04060 [Dehalococcoidia bacterium]|nr:hypothetical protein [Dehalococcoidia bacterium]
MPVITVNGASGSGAREIGMLVSQYAGLDYIDRQVLAEAGRRLGATEEALAAQEETTPSLSERVTRLLRRSLEHSAATGVAGIPFYQPAMDVLVLSPYPETSGEGASPAQELTDRRFMVVVRRL